MAELIAYLGPAGSYSEQAAVKYAPRLEKIQLEKIKDIMRSVSLGVPAGLCGIVPIENMLAGGVDDTLDSFLNRRYPVGDTLDKLAESKNIFIISEIDVRVNHVLMALPGVKDTDIRCIYSHAQALAQCKDFLEEKFPQAEIFSAFSTSWAAQYIEEKKLLNFAAIGAKFAARKYNLAVLHEDIAKQKNNVTRFVVLGKGIKYPPRDAITSFVFSCRQDKPGGLHEILGCLAREKINMTKIESRPSKAAMGDYIFFIDIGGTPQNEKVYAALRNIEKHSAPDSFRILGVYQRRR
ncbi:prephenate dehydratase [Candidatus Termititenax persephonae]|uniref:Prephenate dehydratase n=1 Tax=Candidatus Termititenax persephonae TaxID=2218525 RepID=A0A388TGX2_9BACT|nr:prephenate dehydratase [Candidatus Termititenax persephonae]